MSRKTMEDLAKAFDGDGFDIEKTINFQDARGILARHQTAINYETQKPKRALYVEGTPYQMGYLIGQLVPDDILKMCTDYLDNVVPAFFIQQTTPEQARALKDLLSCIMVDYCNHIYTVHPDLPVALLQEMQGIVDGCKAAGVAVEYRSLFALNAGVDCILSFLYNFPVFEAFRDQKGTSPRAIASAMPGLVVSPAHARTLAKVKRQQFRIPIFCNAFSVFGPLTEDGSHFFGRDFMFPAAGVFQHIACPIIYNPDPEAGKSTIPLVSMAAPGFVGSIAAMNAEGMGMGVDMGCSILCDFTRPGLNSLLMVRHCMHGSASAEQAIDLVADAQRGVSWLYPIADGKNGRAACVEAGMTVTAPINPLSYAPVRIRQLLPPANAFQQDRNGIMVRWNDYAYPGDFLAYNPALFKRFKKPYHAECFSPTGYLAQTWTDTSIPGSYFYAPQRESLEALTVTTNEFITPEMRTVAMHSWTNQLIKPHLSDIQWRNDELTHALLEALGQCGSGGPAKISFDKAREIIDFLNPAGKFPDYYAKNPRSSDGQAAVIEGTVSLFDLTHLKMTSHYGYYPDAWVTVSLDQYV